VDVTDGYDEALGYDADHSDESQYCRHGSFIGSWWGPDYLCGACEMGVSDRAWRASGEANEARAWGRRLNEVILELEIKERCKVTGLTQEQVAEFFAEIREMQDVVNEAVKARVDELYDGIPEEEFGA
jgi:hypothetical protein